MKYKTDTCILYLLNEIKTVIVTIYIYDTLDVGDRKSLMDTIEFIIKEYTTLSTGELDDFVGCRMKCDLTKMTLKTCQPHLITKMTQEFNNNMKSLMNSNTPSTPHKEMVRNQ